MKTKGWIKRKAGSIPIQRWHELQIRSLNAEDPSSAVFSLVRIDLPPLTKLPEIQHLKTQECIYFIEGSATALLNGKRILMKAGQYLYLHPKVWHSFRSGASGVSAICIYTPRLDHKNLDVKEANGKKNGKITI